MKGELVILGDESAKYYNRTAGALWITEKKALDNGWNLIRADYGVDWAGHYGPGMEFSRVLMVLKNDGKAVGISIACRAVA